MAIAPVVIEFLAKGMPQVQQAFKSIQDAAVRAERAQQVEADKTEKAVKRSAELSAKAKIAAMRKVDAWERQARTAGEREAARSERMRIQSEERVAKMKIAAMKAADRWEAQARMAGLREAARIERQKTQEADRAEKQRMAIRERSASMAGRLAAKQAADEARAAKKAQQAVAQAHRDRIDRSRQAEKDLDVWQRSIQRQQAKDAKVAASGSKEPKLPGRNNAALGRLLETAVGTTVRGVGAGLSRAGSIAMGLATTAGQLGGGFSVADAVMGEKNLRKQAAVLSASTILAGDDPQHGRKFTTDEVLSKAKAIGIAQGIDPSEVLSSFDEVKKLSGNLEKAIAVSPSVAKIATATGADLSDTSKLAGNILAANPEISAEALDSQLRLFTKQGVVGGVEVQDFARYGSRITAGASMYGGNKEKNEAVLGAMAQMSRQYGSASSPAEAALGSLRFSTDVAKKADALKANGIDVSDGKGTIRDAQSIILDMLKKSGGDVTKLTKMGLGERGVKPLEGAAAIFRNAGGGEKGLEAVKKEFAKYTTGVTKEEIDAANKRVLAEQQVEIEMQKLKLAMGEQLLPEFTKLIPVLKDLIPAFADAAKVGIPAFAELMKTVSEFVKANKGIIESLAAHPVGSLIAFELTKSFASAGLPALLRGLFAGAFGSSHVPGATPGGGGGGGGGKPGSVGVAEGGVITMGLMTAYNGYQNYKAGDKRAADLAAAVRSGAISPDDAAKEIAAAKGRISEDTGSFGGGILRGAASAIMPGYGAYNAYNKSEQTGDHALVGNKELQRAIAEAAAAGVREGVANGLKNNSGANGAGRSESILTR